MPRRPRHPALTAVIVAVGVGLAVSCDGFRDDEIACEQAVAHLVDCCPDFHPETLSCSAADHEDACGNLVSHDVPTFSHSESECIKGASCAELVGVHCNDAQQGTAPVCAPR